MIVKYAIMLRLLDLEVVQEAQKPFKWLLITIYPEEVDLDGYSQIFPFIFWNEHFELYVA